MYKLIRVLFEQKVSADQASGIVSAMTDWKKYNDYEVELFKCTQIAREEDSELASYIVDIMQA